MVRTTLSQHLNNDLNPSKKITMVLTVFEETNCKILLKFHSK